MMDRLWFKIGEAAERVGATPKELRYWEKVIPELCPRRSKGNLRYYHQEELARLQQIRRWLSEGFTVSDCRALLQGGSLAPSGPTPQGSRAPAPGTLEAAVQALRRLHWRLGLPAGQTSETPGLLHPPHPATAPEDLPPRPRRVSLKRAPDVRTPEVDAEAPATKRRIASSPLSAELLEEPEGEISSPDPDPPLPKPRQSRKAKPDANVLGRMWSETRLPLDWEE